MPLDRYANNSAEPSQSGSDASSKNHAKPTKQAAEDGAHPYGVTLLIPNNRPGDGKLMTKRYDVIGNSVAVTPYSKATFFNLSINQASGLRDFLRLLQHIESRPDVCLIRGAPIEGIERKRTRRRVGIEIADVPRRWVMFDVDKIPMPPGADLLAEPEDAARRVLDVLVAFAPELDGVTAIVQFSASAGIRDMAEAEEAVGEPPRWRSIVKADSKPTISGHVWFWLSEPVDGPALKRWTLGVNERAGFGLLDVSLCGANQPHYTAAPVFGAKLHDPLLGRRTHFIEGDADEATLDIPAVAARPVRPATAGAGQAVAGPGYSAKLDAIGGPGGFHNTINSAIASYVATTWSNPDAEALIADIQARVLAANPGERSAQAIRDYASPELIGKRLDWWIELE